MKRSAGTISIIIGFILLLFFASSAQISTKAPDQFISASSPDLGFNISHIDLSYNHLEQVDQELLDTNTIRIIAKGSGLTEEDLKTIVIAPWEGSTQPSLFQLKKPNKAFRVLEARLRDYVECRAGGHTRAFILTALTNTIPPLIKDPELRILATNQPFVPLTLWRKGDSGTYTNRAGEIVSITTSSKVVNGQEQTTSVTNIPQVDEVCRWVTYKVTDGEIEWIYMLQFGATGALDNISSEKCDAKEDDPKYKKIIKQIENEVELEMKKNGTSGHLGSVHEFWRLKQEKLKAKGIEWRSPSELNRNICFD